MQNITIPYNEETLALAREIIRDVRPYTPEQLAEIPAILATKARYFWANDLNDWEAFRNVYTEEDGAVTIKLVGRLDSVSSGGFQSQAIERCKGKPTTLDMDGISYLSSAGLRTILALDKAIGDNKLTIINAKDSVKDVLDMSGFSDFI